MSHIATLNFHHRNYRALLQNIKKSNDFLNHFGWSEQGYITMVNAYHSCELWTKSVRKVARGAAVLFPVFSLLMLSIAGVAVPSTPALAMTINCTGGPQTVVHPTIANVFVDVSAGTCVIGSPAAGPGLGDVEMTIRQDFGLGRVIGARYLANGGSLFSRFQMCDFGDGDGDKGIGGCSSATPPLNTNLTGTFEWDSTSIGAPFATDRRLTVNYTVAANGGTITSAQLTILSPEINVTGNGQSIASGDVTPDAADHTSFGAAAVTGGTVARTFTIENSGDGDLDLGSFFVVSLAGANAGDFSVTAQPFTVVAAGGGTQTFTVAFDPSAVGNREATVSIANNDADEAPYTFAISGTGQAAAPEISVSGNTVEIASGDTTPAAVDLTEFGATDVAAGTISRSFTIANTGAGVLTLGANAVSLAGANAADFIVAAQPATTVAAATSTTFTIRFDPSAAGARTATITINNDDADEAPYTFAIQGTGEVVAPEIAVEGNGIEISSGDTNPSTIDDTDFGKVDQTAGALTRSFTIQNTGNGVLTLGANAVSLTGSGDFTISTQPPTSIAASGSTTFALTFDPSSLGARTATVSIANDDADEAPYTFAVSGTGVDGGNITLVQNITGPDVTTEFSSPTASLTTSLRTANGTASLLIPNVLPGTHTVTAANLTNLGYGITDISCNDTDSTGDIATATATITLAAGEDVTCTFTAIESREATSTLIADFLGARNTFLLANQPGSGRRIGRFSSVASQTTTGSASGFGLSGAIPVPVQASLTATTLSFTSHYAWTGPSGLNAGEASDEDRKAHERDIWIEGQIAGFNDANANGTFGVVYAGADQLITPDILLGALVQYDWFSQDGDTDGSEVTGTGWMAGPYATFKLDEGFFADLRAAWGQSSNDINPTGTYTDSFDTNRWLVSGSLIGSYQVDRWTIQPAASLSYIRETQESYTDSLNVVIPEQSVSQGEFRAGPKLSYVIVFESGNRLTPSFNFDGAYTFGNDGLYSSGSLAREVQGLRGRAGFSLDLATTSDLTVSVASHYDGIGTSADLFGATLRFSMLLN